MHDYFNHITDFKINYINRLVLWYQQRNIRIDIKALDAFKRLAKKSNLSFPKYLEAQMIELAKAEGEIPQEYEMLGETRGGDRKSTAGSEGSAND